jgi:hypothetical protein
MQKPTRKEIDTLLSSGQFDAAWYQRTYPDVTYLGMDPAEHYLTYGHRMGRNAELGASRLCLVPYT